jgi:hypothetical protein
MIRLKLLIFGRLQGFQVSNALLYVTGILLVLEIWHVIPYQQISHGSQPSGFLTPSLDIIREFLFLSQDSLTTAAMISSSLLSYKVPGEDTLISGL